MANNIVQIGYASEFGFPTMGMFTSNPWFVEEANEGLVIEGEFDAFDLVRKKAVSINNFGEIISIQVHNPQGIPPSSLVSGVSWSTKYNRDENIVAFLEQCSPAGIMKSMHLLPRDPAVVLLEFFLASDFKHLSKEEVASCHQDLRFSSLLTLERGVGIYQNFLEIDYDSADQVQLDASAKKWFSLIKAYGALLRMELRNIDDSGAREVAEALEQFEFPSDGNFPNCNEIVDYWPYLFSPRPFEIPGSASLQLQARATSS